MTNSESGTSHSLADTVEGNSQILNYGNKKYEFDHVFDDKADQGDLQFHNSIVIHRLQ